MSLTESLTARQRAMLAEMGIRVWSKAPDPGANPDTSPGTDRGHATAAPARQSDAPARTAARPAHTSTRPSPPSGLLAQGASPAIPPAASPASPVSRQTAPAAVSAQTAAAPDLVPRPAPEAIAAMDWTALEATVTACRACALCAGRTQTVFGVGSRRADWMVVGEAPGEQEDRLGQPFVGPSGKLLDHMLAAIGVSRQANADASPERAIPPDATPAPQKKPGGVYIANVLKCRPPNNRNPQPDEVACCEPYLRRQVALVQPKIILTMGRFAVQSLLQTSDPIGRLRGRAHHYQGVPVIVTYHPAYLLRSLPEKAKAWQDLCLALETAKEG